LGQDMRLQFIVLTALLLAGCADDTYANLVQARQDLLNADAASRQRYIAQATDHFNRGLITQAEYAEELQRIDAEFGPAAAQANIDAFHRMSVEETNRLIAHDSAPPSTPSWQPSYPSAQGTSYSGSKPPAPPSRSTTLGDPCQYMSCPPSPAPPTTYIPVSPGDPANAGLDSSGNPTK
jgi:hypothetical protein